MPVLREGDSCWRVVHARRVAWLIDADAYFRALGAALDRAQGSVRILAWDFDGRVSLLRSARRRLSATLIGLARRGVRTDVLMWSHPWLLTLYRRWFPGLRLRLWSRKVRVRLDSSVPWGACHHQKLVVVDEKVAFTGGIDLAMARRPWHDVMVMVDGEAAGAFAELVAERWGLYGRELEDGSAPGADPWPSDVIPDVEDVRVGIARTDPRLGVKEIERLYLAAIASARRSIYAENPYLSSRTLRDALAERLSEADGPEIVIVTPLRGAWWFERLAMDVLRARWIRHLQARDPYDRLRVLAPVAGPIAVAVHSKVLIVDDALVVVGSANLADRSMALDTECNLAVEADGDARIEAAVADLRHRLLGEHLGCGAEAFARAEAREGELRGAIRAENRGRLLPVDSHPPGWLDALVPGGELVDPHGPPRLGDWVWGAVTGRPLVAIARAGWRAVRTPPAGSR